MAMEADYLVVGAGLAGLGFLDTLIERSDATALIVDRRHAPGGHWVDCYPFVRLHQPSHLYGVSSMPMGHERIVRHGLYEGRYECASGFEIRGYFDQVMQHRLLASGRVQFLPRHEYLGNGRVQSLVTGRVHEVRIKRRTVDATFHQAFVPQTSAPPFEVADGVRCVPPGALTRLDVPPAGYVLIGGGKTSIDTCLWLLQQGVDPERIRWIRPRDIWLLNRNCYEGRRHLNRVIEGVAAQFEAAASAPHVDAFYEQCEQTGTMLRLDPRVRPRMLRGATCGQEEVEVLRNVEQVVRMGHVRRIEADRVVLEQGEIPTSPGHLHVHCAADGTPVKASVPIFQPQKIVLQLVRQGSPAFSYGLIGLVEASDREDAEKNRLLPPNATTSTPLDWMRAIFQATLAERGWRKESDIERWKSETALNVGLGVQALGKTAEGAALLTRLGASAGPGLSGMQRLLGEATQAERRLFWPRAST